MLIKTISGLRSIKRKVTLLTNTCSWNVLKDKIAEIDQPCFDIAEKQILMFSAVVSKNVGKALKICSWYTSMNIHYAQWIWCYRA